MAAIPGFGPSSSPARSKNSRNPKSSRSQRRADAVLSSPATPSRVSKKGQKERDKPRKTPKVAQTLRRSRRDSSPVPPGYAQDPNYVRSKPESGLAGAGGFSSAVSPSTRSASARDDPSFQPQDQDSDDSLAQVAYPRPRSPPPHHAAAAAGRLSARVRPAGFSVYNTDLYKTVIVRKKPQATACQPCASSSAKCVRLHNVQSEGSKTVLADVRILVLSYLAYNKGRSINAPALKAAHARLKAVHLKETRSKLEVPSLDSSRSPRSSSSANKADLTVQRDIHARLLAVKRHVKASKACLLNIRAQLLAFNKDFHAAFLGQYIVPQTQGASASSSSAPPDSVGFTP
ncbi:hypothetical protein K504DRAFT_508960 [Pleomassaria siparia CBS 279.74]|uniref:Uncharacterized protein n=1 Tax=Pleomassaria siparia CBS 279.74 TaxID=1314801 RepID=A0A6G1JQN9_9PLEO|nr:hypothetical protein K504DRAFT_508960 [Pleomassaria siparia CBS 279.74]